MALLVRKPGLLTTVQDLGRAGSRRFGINPNGATDVFAARAVNILLGNDENDALLEMHFPAGEFEFEKDCCFAIGGAEFRAELDGIAITNWTVHKSSVGSILKFTERAWGNRAYIGVSGRFDVDRWLGSYCTNLVAKCGGFEGRAVQKGDRIEFPGSEINATGRRLAHTAIPRYSRFPTVRVVAGPEYEWLSVRSRDLFESEGYSISKSSNRMGYRLEGEPLERISSDEMISSGVTFGTIQLLPDGNLIVLMSDHQTTGGYPRVANVTAVDLPLLAQLGPGDGVGFHLVSNRESEEALLDRERDFDLLKVGCMFR